MHLAEEAERRASLDGFNPDLPEDIAEDDDDAYVHEENNWPGLDSDDEESED